MSIRSLLATLAALCALDVTCSVGAAKAADLKPGSAELHVIGVYEGSPSFTRGRNGGAPVPVRVVLDRPGKAVTLVVMNCTQVLWKVEPSPKTQIQKIVVADCGLAATELAVSGDQHVEVSRRTMHGAYDVNGIWFRAIVEKLAPELGFVRLDSFHGEYTAPDEGFLINDVQHDIAAYGPNYLRYLVMPVASDEALRAEGFVDMRMGEFLPNGKMLKKLPLARSASVAMSADRERVFLWEAEGIYEQAGATGTKTLLGGAPISAFKLNPFRAMTFDEKRNRLLAIFQGGAAYSDVMAFDLTQRVWSRLGSSGKNDPTSMWYDAAADRVLIAGSNFDNGGFIGAMSADGAFSMLQEFDYLKLPGMGDLFDPPGQAIARLHVLGVDGDRVVLGSNGDTGGYPPKRQYTGLRRMWIVDLGAGDVDLTYYD